ncbi:MAG: hypothetical protein ABSH06_23475 [Thermodesulfobacteriota bacterium]
MRRREIVMRRTNREILEGCKYYKDFNKGKRVKKRVVKPEVGEQLLLPFPENEAVRGSEEKDRK